MTEQNPQGTETDPVATTTDPSPAAAAAPQGGAEPNGADTDWKARSREWEKRAKENKTAADELARIKETQKTEAEKLAERVTAAESLAAETTLANLRLEVALDKAPEGAPLAEIRKLAKRLAGSTREELETDADELFGGVLAAAPAGNRRPDPSQGHSNGGAPSLAEQIRAAETSGDVMGAIALKNQLLNSK